MKDLFARGFFFGPALLLLFFIFLTLLHLVQHLRHAQALEFFDVVLFIKNIRKNKGYQEGARVMRGTRSALSHSSLMATVPVSSTIESFSAISST